MRAAWLKDFYWQKYLRIKKGSQRDSAKVTSKMSLKWDKVIKWQKKSTLEDQKIYDEKMIKPEPSVSVKQISLVTPTSSKNLFNFYGRNIA